MSQPSREAPDLSEAPHPARPLPSLRAPRPTAGISLLSALLLTGCLAAGDIDADEDASASPDAAATSNASAEDSSSAPEDTATTTEDSGAAPDTASAPDTATADAPPRRDTPTPGMCEAPMSACGVTCVDLQGDPDNCGVCGRTCRVPNAEAGCAGGECAVAQCAPGFYDADGAPENGCELEDSCAAGGLCETSCGSTGEIACVDGQERCAPLAEQCNGIDDDCDGACDGGIAGCRVGIHRGNGNGHVYSDDQGFVSRAPYRLESANYFHLYRDPYQGMRPAFLCRKPNGKRFLTSATDCEIGVAPERQIGFWSPTEICGAIRLYRLYNPADGNHFYTISAPERDNARDNLGFRDEGTAAWVWRGP